MIITVGGMPGAGKTTIVRALAQHFGFPWYSMGDIRGAIALKHGITIDELNRLGETDPITDQEVDDYQKKLGESGNSFIIDGRMSWYFLPNSFKIFISVDPDIGAKRIFEASKQKKRQDEKPYISVEETREMLAERVASDKRRYQTHYGTDFLDLTHYDLVIDSSHESAEKSLERIIFHLPRSVPSSES